MKPINTIRQRQAMTRKLERRIACEGKITFPAVPSMADDYTSRCEQTFAAAGRKFSDAERDKLRKILGDQLQLAFRQSQRSTVTVSYQAQISGALNYFVTPQHASLEQIYEGWVNTRQPPFFGTEPDAKVLAVAQYLGDARACRVLDIGAGTGRNALALARKMHPVDAVELTPKFAEILDQSAKAESLDVRVICKDVFEANDALQSPYQLILLSEVVSDFRSVAQLRQLFELASQCLAPNGILLINAFVAQPHYSADDAAREFAQQVYACFFTADEFDSALNGLPMAWVSSESVYDFESAHLPASAWPPTEWYPNWVSGLDVFDLHRQDSPVDLRWLTFKKVLP